MLSTRTTPAPFAKSGARYGEALEPSRSHLVESPRHPRPAPPSVAFFSLPTSQLSALSFPPAISSQLTSVSPAFRFDTFCPTPKILNQVGVFVYRLGHGPLKAERRVRFPYALPTLQAPPELVCQSGGLAGPPNPPVLQLRDTPVRGADQNTHPTAPPQFLSHLQQICDETLGPSGIRRLPNFVAPATELRRSEGPNPPIPHFPSSRVRTTLY